MSVVVGITLAACGGSNNPDGGGSGGNGSTGGGGSGSIGGGGSGGSGPSGGGDAGMGGASSGGGGTYDFPSGALFYQDISKAALDSQSGAIISQLQSVGWDGGQQMGIDASFTVMIADPSLTRRSFTQSSDVAGDPSCDTAPVPVPPGGHIEGESNYTCSGGGDCHLLVYQGTRLYELYQADISSGNATGGTFTGACLAVWDLTHDYWAPGVNPYSRGETCNGADAGDIPMATLILKPEEVKAGAVNHALRFTLPNDHILKSVYVHPATHIGGPSATGNYPPYGSRFRLRADFDMSRLPSAAAKTVAVALQKYGMFLADGGNIYISATDDIADAINPHDLKTLQPQDFEIVDGGSRLTWKDNCKRTIITN